MGSQVPNKSTSRSGRRAGRCLLCLIWLTSDLAGCSASSDRLLIEIIHPGGRDPALWAGELQVAVLDAQTEEVAVSASIPTSDLRNAARLFDALKLEVGRVYVVALNALLTGVHPCKPTNRAVGFSPPFTYEGDPPALSIYLDCADQVSSAALLAQPRLYHSATFLASPAPHGRVVIVGGVSLKSLTEPRLEDATVHDSIEVFDPGLNIFTRLPARLSRPRAFHGAVATGPDQLLLTGGLDTVNVGGTPRLQPLDLVDRLEGDRLSALEPLVTPRALHAALQLEDRLLVAGGLDDKYLPTRAAELYDPAEGRRAGELPKMSTVHVVPGTVVVGGLALIIGGVWWPDVALPEDHFCLDGSCGGCAGPCFAELSGFPKGQGRAGHGVAHVPCADGPGAVYVVGGHHDASEAASAPAETYDDIYCVEIERLERGLRRVGGLLGPRRNHTVSVVRGPKDSRRLFVAGGSDDGDILLKNAELVPVGCGCAAIDSREIRQVELKNERSGHTATVLADGSVLLVGGFVGADSAERFTPTF